MSETAPVTMIFRKLLGRSDYRETGDDLNYTSCFFNSFYFSFKANSGKDPAQ